MCPLHINLPNCQIRKTFPAQKEVNFSLLRMNHRTLEVIIQETKNLEENSLKILQKPFWLVHQLGFTPEFKLLIAESIGLQLTDSYAQSLLSPHTWLPLSSLPWTNPTDHTIFNVISIKTVIHEDQAADECLENVGRSPRVGPAASNQYLQHTSTLASWLAAWNTSTLARAVSEHTPILVSR